MKIARLTQNGDLLVSGELSEMDGSLTTPMYVSTSGVFINGEFSEVDAPSAELRLGQDGSLGIPGEISEVSSIFGRVGLPITDSFNRADSTTTLGTTDTGQVWQSFVANNVWGIQNSQACPVTPNWDDPIYVDAGVSDNVAFQVEFSVVHPQQQVMWRIMDGSINYFCIQGNTIYNVVNNNWGDSKGTIAPALANGDVVRVELLGNKHTVKVNEQVKFAYISDSHLSGTKFGLSANPSGTTLRYDNVLIEDIIDPTKVIPDVPSTAVIEDFSDDTYNFTITQDQTYPWNRFDTASIDGNLGYMKSSNNTVNSTTSLVVFDVLVPAGTARSWIEIDYGIDSEINYDYLYIHVNDVEKLKLSGPSVTGMFTSDLVAGTHKVKVSYKKDGNAHSVTDSAYISGMRLLHQ